MKKILSSIFTLVLTMVLGTIVVYALSPTIDGDDTGDWGTNPTSCTIGNSGCSRAIDDPVDVTSPAAPHYDIARVYVTNDPTTLFLRLDFQGNGDASANTWRFTVSNRPLLTICFDIDSNTATGVTRSAGNCDGDEAMDGVDYFVQFTAQEFSPNNPSITFVDCSSGSCGVATATIGFGYDEDADAITEISIPLSSLGVTGSTCPGGGSQPCSFRLGMFYDNGVAASDDSVPDTGTATAQFGGGSPTAVSLQNSTASSASPFMPVMAAIVVALVGTGVVLVRRQRA